VLKQHAQAAFMREAIKARKLTLWEAFCVFDADDNGMLSPDELFGALLWLNVPSLTPDDVIDLLEYADKNRDGMIDYREYLDLLRDPAAQQGGRQVSMMASIDDAAVGADGEVQEQQEDEFVAIDDGDHANDLSDSDPDDDDDDDQEDSPEVTGNKKKKKKKRKALPPKIEPYGAELLRKLMQARKRAEQQREREENMRQIAYENEMDQRIFQEELSTKSKKGDANPKVSDIVFGDDDNDDVDDEEEEEGVGGASSKPKKAMESRTVRVSEYAFFTKKKPLRMTSTGSVTFKEMDPPTMLDPMGVPMLLRENPHVQSYLSCEKGSSFTLQVPPTATTKPHWLRYTITMEIMVERFPPGENLMSLLTFTASEAAARGVGAAGGDQEGAFSSAPPSFASSSSGTPSAGPGSMMMTGSGAPRKQQATLSDLYIDSSGFVHNGDVPTPRSGAPSDTNPDADADSLASSSKRGTIAASTPSDAGDATGRLEPDAPQLTPRSWDVVGIVVDGKAGLIRTYINGRLCATCARRYPNQDVALAQQLLCFGGGRLSESRGGNIRQFSIYDETLSPSELETRTFSSFLHKPQPEAASSANDDVDTPVSSVDAAAQAVQMARKQHAKKQEVERQRRREMALKRAQARSRRLGRR